jgi:uncharacterized oxidoreductase
VKLTGNTIFITGGGTGIGQALAIALHERGNRVIIAGRRQSELQKTAQSRPGMETLELDLGDPAKVAAAGRLLTEKYPALNVLINNAGIMRSDAVEGPVDDALLTATVATNLLGPIRMTSALIEHLKRQPAATVINVTSGLAFAPLASSAVYSATKAAIHSYTLSLRHRLRRTSVRVLELAPPYVQTEITPGQSRAAAAMPLADFIRETMQLLGTDADEVLVERVKGLRNNPGPNEHAFVREFNEARESAH